MDGANTFVFLSIQYRPINDFNRFYTSTTSIPLINRNLFNRKGINVVSYINLHLKGLINL